MKTTTNLTLFYIIIFSLAGYSGKCQTSPSLIDTLLIGTWKGTSICQIKNSPCHDEVVVYHISKNKNIDTFYINANKIINGKEEEMGILPFKYDQKAKQLVSTAHGQWIFNVTGTKLKGTLIVRGTLYRIIEVIKQY